MCLNEKGLILLIEIVECVKLFTKRQNLRPVQFESICRHFKCRSNDDLCY